MTISLRVLLAAAVLAALGLALWGGLPRDGTSPAAAVSADAAPAVAASPDAPLRQTPEHPYGTVDGSWPGTKLTLLSLRRTGPKVVSARLRISFDSTDDDIWIPWQPEDRDREWSAEEMRLVDEVNGREHFVLRNADSRCLCSGDFEALERGESSVISAKFPAPPADVDHVSLETPGFPSFDAVPLA